MADHWSSTRVRIIGAKEKRAITIWLRFLLVQNATGLPSRFSMEGSLSLPVDALSTAC